jgi:hypothetical protein
MSALCQLQPLPLDHVPPLIFYYQPEHTFVLNRTLFAQALTIAPHLSLGGFFGMVYEHISRCFIPEYPFLGFSKYFKLFLLLFVVISLGQWHWCWGLADCWQWRRTRKVISEVFFWLISCSIVLQVQGSFQEHLSPHEFGVLIFGGCENIPFDIKALSDLHPNWVMMQVNVENAFNNVFRAVIFKELWDVKDLWQALSLLPCCFMVLILLFTTNMGSMRRGSPLLNHLQAWSKVNP